jgi:chromosome segregation ATPase
MESYISYMNESNAENYGKLIDQQDQLWKLERMLKDHQEKSSLPDPLFSNLEQRIDGIIEILDGDIKREEARDLRLESVEKESSDFHDMIRSLSDRLESMEKEIGFLHEKLHHKDSTIDYLTNSLESFLSAKKEPMKETVIMPENKENSSLMANREKPAHKRIKSSLTQHFSEHPDKKKSVIPKVEVNLDFQSHDIQKPPINKKK